MIEEYMYAGTGIGMLIRRQIGFLFLLSLVMGTLVVQASTLQNPKAYRVVYSVTVTNISCQMDSLEIWIPRPIQWNAQRDVCIEEVIPAASNVYADSVHGNGICYWLSDNPPAPGNSVTVSQTFTYVAYDVSFNVDPSLVGVYDQTSSLYR